MLTVRALPKGLPGEGESGQESTVDCSDSASEVGRHRPGTKIRDGNHRSLFPTAGTEQHPEATMASHIDIEGNEVGRRVGKVGGEHMWHSGQREKFRSRTHSPEA